MLHKGTKRVRVNVWWLKKLTKNVAQWVFGKTWFFFVVSFSRAFFFFSVETSSLVVKGSQLFLCSVFKSLSCEDSLECITHCDKVLCTCIYIDNITAEDPWLKTGAKWLPTWFNVTTQVRNIRDSNKRHFPCEAIALPSALWQRYSLILSELFRELRMISSSKSIKSGFFSLHVF